jgi:hypothetical protein
MRKLFILSILAMMIAWGIGGCGGGGGATSSDPLGTDSLMFGHKNDAAGTEWTLGMQVTPQSTVVLTARIKNASGTAVAGREVTFGFKANQSGAVLSTFTANTDATGEATILYRAGTANGFDVVHASISNGAQMDTNITVSSGVVSGTQIALQGIPSTLLAGQTSIIVATVTDNSGSPLSGAFVSFSFLSNRSGALPLSALNAGMTDGGGKAVAVYTAGSSTPNSEVQDTIQASVTGSTGAIVMTRTAAGGGVGTGFRMTVTATPTSLYAGAMSVIVAQVNNADGTAAARQDVTFKFVTNNSGAPDLTVVNATTDAAGKALAIYTAGSGSPNVTIDDAVSASVTGSAGAAIITRLAATATGNRISLTLNPATKLPSTTGTCIVQATVVRTDGVTPVANETVTFSIVTGGGNIAPLSAQTNNSGFAFAVFTAPGTATGNQAVVRAQIPGTANGGDAVGIITW